MQILERLSAWTERRFVAGWSQSWKWASVQLAAAFAVVVGLLAENPGIIEQLLGLLPDSPARSVLISLAALILPLVLRLWKQTEPDPVKPSADAIQMRPQFFSGPVSSGPGRTRTSKLGLSASIALIISAVFAVEGGFVDHPSDPGGATNHGITEAVARAHGYRGNMRDLPRATAFEIYRTSYIRKPGFEPLIAIDAAVAEEVIDTAVNMGPARPSRYFQRAVNRVCNTQLTIDGKIGPKSVGAWRDCRTNLGPPSCVRMLDLLDRQQEAEYDRLVRVNSSLGKFRRGWQNHRIGNVDRARCQ